MKGTIHQEEIPNLNIYPSNTGIPNNIKKTQMALKAQRVANTLIVVDLNTPVSPIDKSSRQNINKETSELLYTLDQ
jgi:hypothetical protein